MVAFYKMQEWQNELMNVLLHKQEWHKDQLPPVLASLPKFRMPDFHTGWYIVRATGVSGNHQSPSGNLHQATLT